MKHAHLLRPLLGLAGVLALAGCYDDGYYGGVGPGYGYYDDGYYGYDDWYGPGYGWWDGYYYPGGGAFVYDRFGHRHPWRDNDRNHWQNHGSWNGGHGNWQGRANNNWQGRGNWQGRSGNWQGRSGGNWQGRSGGNWSGGHMSSPSSSGGGWSGGRGR